MEKPTNKSNESTISTTGTTGTPPYSDTMDNNVKYMNLNFIDNSESSSQAKEAAQEFKTSSFEAPKVTKAPPSKIRPSNLPFTGKIEALRCKDEPSLQEKSLLEMGFKCTEIEGWENIVQPPKENLYKLLKNMIDNHIKPNVQIRIGGVTFNCHMMVLQCYSDFFMECNNEVLIQLPEEKITPGAFMMVYDWMLAEEPLVQREGILELFNAANFLRIKDLVNQCWLCLDDDVRFREDTAFLLYLEARNYALESLEQLMLTRICKFFLTLVSSKEFLHLNAKEICTLLSSNTIGVNSEIEIFMSVVRWLSKNWAEREPSMLRVVKCVRFSLMPPWFLVTLNKNTDCVEIDRIVSHPEVKKMINDGISFTTTQLYYGDNREEFLHFLERYQLVAPMQRQWVFDKECSYHHRLDCPNMQYVTYKSFLEYLEMIQTIGKNYWRTLEMAKGVEKTMQCCVRSDCRKTNEQNVASVFTKKSRDQGVQVEATIRARKGHHKDRKESLTTKDCKNSKSCSLTNDSIHRNLSKSANNATATSASLYNLRDHGSDEQHHHCYQYSHLYQQVEPKLMDQQQPQQQLSKTRAHLSVSKKLLPKETSGTDETNTCVVRRTMISDNNAIHNRRNQSIGHQHSNEHVFAVPTTGAVADTLRLEDGHEPISDAPTIKLKRHANKSPLRTSFAQTNISNNLRPKTKAYQHDIVADDHIEHIQKHSNSKGSSSKAVEFNLFTNRKILIFGGIDPYCQHCLNDEKLTPGQQQQLHQPKHHKHQRSCMSQSGGGDADSIDLDNYGDQVLYYDAQGRQWKHLSYIPFGSRHHHAAVVCNGLIYVIGGTRTALGCTKKSIFEKSVWSFDIEYQKWTLESSLPESRRDFAVVAIDDKTDKPQERKEIGTGFYIIGGEGVNGTALSSVWFYDVIKRSWAKKASLNVGRYGLAAVMVDNEIWVGGGIIDERMRNLGGGDSCGAASAEMITDTIECYSLQCAHDDDNFCGDGSDEDGISWIQSDIRLRVPRLFGRFCKTDNNDVYIVGGIGMSMDNAFTSLSSIDHFDKANDKWLHYGDIHWARHGHDVVTLNEKIIIIGGVSTIEKRTLTKVESFCTKSRKCVKEIPELPWPLSGSAVVVL